ncbi:hypothetical protein [Marinigracilibium pacificum]|uniref:Lipocalin-like domain-containing protein n=1 Tax=Marinigracilibium pacificum TaxID=2729599 RepID=A0A848J8W2_9BACT|nr:hypothetical protein [Marinigracilibium pacificum]NMM50819.1 hypothetical protein [Marinigracilibium pacificum]
MTKKILIIFSFIFLNLSCSSNLDKGIIGWWTIDEIYHKDINIFSNILSNSIYFYSNGTCDLPVTLENKSQNKGEWQIFENNPSNYSIHIMTENKIFKGDYHMQFHNNKKDRMLMLTLESDSLIMTARKGLLNYQSNLSRIKELVEKTN